VANRISFISRTYRHFSRYREIASVLVKHGFEGLIVRLHLHKYIDIGRKFFHVRPSKKIASLSTYERIRMVLEELGPTFIKFGQIMSNRPDILPKELIKELEKLQDTVLPFPASKAKEVIEKELGKNVESLFKNFDLASIASASIAQVHAAIIFEDDEDKEVVIKVQRPDIIEKIETDIEIMLNLARIAEKHIPGARLINLVDTVKEFERIIKKELDFSIEALYMQRFTDNFRGEKDIYVPKVYKEFSTSKVLTMEHVNGIKVSKVDEIRETGLDTKIIAHRITQLMLKQVFIHGFFHADPHPGNIIVLEDGKICFLDFGMMGVLHPKEKNYLSNIILGIVNQDSSRIVKTVLQFSGKIGIEDQEELEYQISDLVDRYAYLPLKDIKLANLTNEMMDIIFRFKLKMPSNLYPLSKAVLHIEHIARELDPNFDLMHELKPFANQIIMESFSPRNIIKEFASSINDVRLLLLDLPSHMHEILEQVKTGSAKIEFEHKGLEPALKKTDQVSNRIAFAIVIAALIIGSSLIVLSDIPPKVNGTPIIGIIGFIGAGILGLWLVISIIRHGKL
jgi:ubiquinone biosynthesis protein